MGCFTPNAIVSPKEETMSDIVCPLCPEGPRRISDWQDRNGKCIEVNGRKVHKACLNGKTMVEVNRVIPPRPDDSSADPNR